MIRSYLESIRGFIVSTNIVAAGTDVEDVEVVIDGKSIKIGA